MSDKDQIRASVLDLGSGLGGPARLPAAEYDWTARGRP
jgi:hypothetical protein